MQSMITDTSNIDSDAEISAGSYYLGPIIKKYVRSPITVCLGRKKGTDDYYLMKTLVLDDSNTSDRGLYVRRTVFHNEYSILSLLKNHEGVIQLHDFFKDYIYKENLGQKQKLKRVCMAMECLFPHGPYNSDLVPLNHFLKEDRVSETEALQILYNLLSVIEKLHKSNVVHREIKLSNIIVNKKTLKVKLMDFYYAKLVTANYESQCKSMISTSLPKTNDVWAAGVVFYAMLCSGNSTSGASKFGSLLSSVRSIQDLYFKFVENKCNLLKNISIADGTKEILCCILCTHPQYRLKASEALEMVQTVLAIRAASQNVNLLGESTNNDQIVPECPNFDCQTQSECEILKGSVNSTRDVRKTEDMVDNYCTDAPLKTIDFTCDGNCHETSQVTTKLSSECTVVNNEKIKFAMMRLGATSINNINALSFNYIKRNSCPSEA